MWKRTGHTALGLVAALLMTLGVATPAFAHDSLATSDPQDGDILPTAPAKVTLVYSADVKNLGAQIVVKGPAGEVQEGAPSIDKMVVTQPLKAGIPAGSYTVLWRVTSSDGHPISGQIHFSVTGGTTATSTSAHSSAQTSTSAAAPTSTTTGAASTTAPTTAATPSLVTTGAPVEPTPSSLASSTLTMDYTKGAAAPTSGSGEDDNLGVIALVTGIAFLLVGGAVYLWRRYHREE